MSETSGGAPPRRGPLIGIYLVAAACGYLLGVRGLLMWSPSSPKVTSATPLARVGFVLRQESPRATPADWAALGHDLDVVRASYAASQRDVFDLVVAVRGLDNGGAPDWQRAEQRCRALAWPRCDRAALEDLEKRSRP
jgi:hypothetical protein